METIIFCGIQGSGKSTFYLRHFYHTHVRLNLDMLRTRHREAILLHACLAAQQPFVIDNTNATIAKRARYISLAKAAGFRVTGYFFTSPLADALARNAQRTGRQQIPPQAIAATNKRLEPPTPAEGYDALHHVRIAEDGTFIVEAWREEMVPPSLPPPT